MSKYSHLEPGYYFVRRKPFLRRGREEWEIAEYVVGLWHFIFDTDEYTDSDIIEVGEKIEKKAKT